MFLSIKYLYVFEIPFKQVVTNKFNIELETNSDGFIGKSFIKYHNKLTQNCKNMQLNNAKKNNANY